MKLGNGKTQNIVLLGALIKAMSLEKINWEAIIKANVKPNFVDDNLKALKVGMSLV
jgi:indolepyruvate ferredoxin oxidoreductase beta subunit